MLSYFGLGSDAPENGGAQPKSAHTSMNDNAEVAKMLKEEALECDYETNCTALYKHIEEEDWSAVAKFLETGYWPGNFFPDFNAPADQARTWVTRFNKTDEAAGVRWSQLPLHLAIVVEAPYEVVGSLIELYPQAVRCTDDQHMLPLHLAMRHGSSDNVVDLLLAAFPEAVNAKGKNDRTPIECAVRGPNKVRARILGTFVERAKAKATKTVSVTYGREVAALRNQLEDKETQLDDVKSKMSALDAAKAELESELAKNQVQETSPDMVTQSFSKDPEADKEIKQQITTLEQEKEMLVQAQARASEEERKLIAELEKVQLQVAKTASPEDLLALKEEIEALKKSRNYTDETPSLEVEEMKKHIAEELKKADGSTREELKTMQQNIVELHRVASEDIGEGDDLSTLKGEVEGLRTELKRKEQAAKLKVDLSLLKEALASELKESDTKTEEQISALNKALASLNLSDLDHKTVEELTTMKEELEVLHAEVKERRLPDKTTEDVIKLRRRADELTIKAIGKDIKNGLETMKKTLDAIKVAELQGKTNDELLSLNADLSVLREQMKDMEDVTELRSEMETLSTDIEAELKQSRGSKRRDMASLKSALSKVKNYDSKTKFELVSLKMELQSVREELNLYQKARDLKNEISKLKEEAKQHQRKASGTSKSELESILQSLEKIDEQKLEGQSAKDIDEVEVEVSSAKKSLADQELGLRLNSEMKDLRKSISVQLARLEGKKDVTKFKSALAKLSDDQLDAKTTKELIATKEEIAPLENELKEKERVVEDIDAIKAILDDLLKKKEGAVKQDLLTMKATVDAIDLDELDPNNVTEWEDLKSQITFLKKELQDADIADKTKQDLIALKDALDASISSSEGTAKEELVLIKKAVDSIDISKMDADNREEWMKLKKEIDELKKELKAKECESMYLTIDGKLKDTRGGLSKVEISRTTSRMSAIDEKFKEMSYADLVSTKEKLESILADMPVPKEESKTSEAPTMKVPIKKAVAPKKTSTPKKEKSSAKKASKVATPTKETIDKTTSSTPPSVKTTLNSESTPNTKTTPKKQKTPRFRGLFGRRRSQTKNAGESKDPIEEKQMDLQSNPSGSDAASSIPPSPSSQDESKGNVQSVASMASIDEEKKESEDAAPLSASPSEASSGNNAESPFEDVQMTRTTSKPMVSPGGDIELVNSEEDFMPMLSRVPVPVEPSSGGEVETVFVE